MRTLGILTWSAIKMFLRNKQALFFTFFFPVMLMTVLGLINFDRVSKIEVGIVVTAPPNPATIQFIEGLKKVAVFEVHEGIETEERAALMDDKRAAVFVIPADLIPGPSQVKVYTNANQPQQSGTAVNIVSGILDKTALAMTGGATTFTLNSEEVNSNHLRYIDFLLPGLIALSVMQMAVFSVAFVFVTYKEKGILKRLLATPMHPMSFVLSNVITRLIVTLLQTGMFIALGVLIFNAQVVGSYWTIFIIALLGSLMFLGLGFTVSGLASTVESVPPLANLIVFPMMFLGGTFFAVDSFPNWLQSIAKLFPLTFFSDALRSVMTKGYTLSQVSNDIWGMLIWGVILVLLANLAFSFEEKRQ